MSRAANSGAEWGVLVTRAVRHVGALEEPLGVGARMKQNGEGVRPGVDSLVVVPQIELLYHE
jgi:hypothetical protein